jgi:hypothetical protein
VKVHGSEVTSDFVLEHLEQLASSISKPTVIVSDNMPIHTAKKIQARREVLEARGLFLL